MSHTEDWHKAKYDTVRLSYPEHNLPNWEDISEDKKENIRIANIEDEKFFNELGNAISNGGPLPDPFYSKKS